MRVRSTLPPFARLKSVFRFGPAPQRQVKPYADNWPEASEFIAQWDEQRAIATPPRTGRSKVVLVLPSDPDTLVGSKGDEAMLTACFDHFRAQVPDVEFIVLVRSELAKREAVRMGLVPRSVWERGPAMDQFGEILAGLDAMHVVIVGADIMDGFYLPSVSAERFAFADLAARAGLPVTVTGYSFNESPERGLISIVERMDEAVALNVRDPISLQRWQLFTAREANLVADVAFLLRPTPADQIDAELVEWVAGERQRRRIVFAFNLHDAVLRGVADRREALYRVGMELRHAAERRAVSWLLLTHDYRDPATEAALLEEVHRAADLGRVSRLAGRPYSARDLKGIAGLMDGVITGRMHLAVAALGMGVPVAAFDYQGKFEGLFEHFGLSQRRLGQLPELLEDDGLRAFLKNFLSRRRTERWRIKRRLPAVLELARRNFD